MPEEELRFALTGLNMDAVYESFVRQIAGGALEKTTGECLKESVERDGRRKALEEEIAALENRIRKEKQFNRQVEMNEKLKALKKEVERLC